MSNLTIGTEILKSLETSSSIGMFARDTGGCLISRLALSRKKDESKEIGFVETTESTVFYFSAPLAAKAFSNSKNSIPYDDLKNIKNLKTLKDIKLSKFLRLGAVFSLILPVVYAIAPLRNLMSEYTSGKKDFTTIVGLEDKNEKAGEKEKEKVKIKTLKLAKSLVQAASLGLGISAGIFCLGKNDKIYEKIKPALDKILKHFDFTGNCDLKLAHYAALIYPVSILSYFKSSRDKYEKLENARRFSITVPLMFLGEKLIQNPIYKKFDKIYKTNVFNNGNIKSYQEILALEKNEQKQMLKSKNLAYGLTFFTNTMLIAAVVALLNRIATKQKFERDKLEQENGQKIC